MSNNGPRRIYPQNEPKITRQAQFNRTSQTMYKGPSAFALQVFETKANLEKTIAQQKQVIKNFQDRNSAFEGENTAFKKTIDELQSQIKRQNGIITATRKTLDTWTFDTATAILNRETVNDLQSECLLHIIETLKEVIESRNKEHDQKLDRFLKENAKKESELDSFKQSNYGLEDEKAFLHEEIAILEESKNEKEAQILNLSTTLETYKQELAKLNNEAELYSSIVLQLNTKNDCLRKQLKDDAKNKKKLAALLRGKERNLKKVNNLKQRVKELEEEVKRQNKMNFSQMVAKEQKIADLEAEIAKLQNPAVLLSPANPNKEHEVLDDYEDIELSTNYSSLPDSRVPEEDDEYPPNFHRTVSPTDTFENNLVNSSSTQVNLSSYSEND